jgi:hypothetical protein
VIARSRRLIAVGASVLLAAGVLAASASAAEPSWLPVGVSGPTVIPPQQSEIQKIVIDAQGGSFTLTMGQPAAMGFGALTTPGTLTVSGVATSSGTFAVGQRVEGYGIPDDTTITGVGSSTLALSRPLVFKDSQALLSAYDSPATTTPIPYGASAADVQSALEALAPIGAGNVEVSQAGSGEPYVVAFHNGLANTNVSQLSADGSLLIDGAAAVKTTVHGGPATARIALMVQNIGGAASTGEVTYRATLPEGITAVTTPTGNATVQGPDGVDWACDSSTASEVVCTRSTPVRAGLSPPVISVTVTAAPGVESGVVDLEVGGGGAATATGELPLTVSSVPAGPGIQTFVAGAYDENGVADSRAGGHPYSATTAIFPNTVRSVKGALIPIADVEDLVVSLPPGFVGNTTAVPACPESTPVQNCPRETMIGTIEPAIQNFGERGPATPLFNSEGAYGYPAKFRFRVLETVDLNVVASLRSDSDFGADAGSLQTPQIDQFLGAFVTLWGQPADPSHDSVRCAAQKNKIDLREGCGPSTAPNNAFVTNSSDCDEQALVAGLNGGSVPVGLSTTWWQAPAVVSHDTAGVPPVSDCGPVPFDPSVAIDPTVVQPDSPTGLEVGMTFPHEGLLDPAGRDSAHLKRAVVELPEGLTINPAAAGGLDACTDAQLNLTNKSPMVCPDASKIASATATSPLLAESLSGSMFIRSQNSMDPESGEMFRVALVLENKQRGVSVRLPGRVKADADTGRLTAVFDNNPRLPVGDIEIKIKGGSRAPLATPKACGTHEIETELSSWSAPHVPDDVSSDAFDVDCAPGLGSFGPSLSAGTVSPAARGFSPFVLESHKPDGQADIDGLSVSMPKGLLATLKGNVGTRIGTATVAAGPGPDPFWLSGPVVLEGRYDDAPFSLRVTVPVVAGPFNLGDVVVRQKIYVDRTTGQVTVVSDPLPTIVKGVPSRLQNLRVSIDKPGFTFNPSDCDQQQVGATFHAQTGATAAASSPFHASGCASLPFEPKLTLALTGRRQVTTGKHPGVKAVVTQAGVGEAGIDKTVVTLPKSLALDPDNAQALCEYTDGTKPDLENHCPAGSIVGRARAVTPLLNQPLAGNVYFVKNIRIDPKTGNQIRTLPMLIVALRGEVAINLKGESSTTKAGRLVNTFANVPDAPISQFNLNINGGNAGILAVTRTRKAKINICAGRQTTESEMDGHNGRRYDTDVRMKTPCTKKQTKAAKRAAAKARAGSKRG